MTATTEKINNSSGASVVAMSIALVCTALTIPSQPLFAGEVDKGEDIEHHCRFCNMRYGDMSERSRPGADYSGAYLFGANLSWSVFKQGNFQAANLNYARMEWADFDGVDFSEANFEDATMFRSTFRSANLRMANLSRANLSKSD